ncbi:SDR family NAD(P)-dependent oxidoreductase [Sphingomonas montanisoli]|uniref:SDR family oxidoreductase n=1 Tax=Sphingomonas montanisoli TaxID=2606412 RepID=A0A5D9CGN4_9SPHN|nr:SDR family NAD(P)-dependent oxidoreductase [Sphingomonas montanisoli]TZG29235.1 SDR family oxidoreductase [Sphingomonas montanisoli]
MATALLSNAGTRFGLIAAELLAGRRDRLILTVDRDCDAGLRDTLGALAGAEIIEADCAVEADWDRIAALIGDDAIDLQVHCPPAALGDVKAEVALHSAWLAARNANRLMRGQGTLLVQYLTVEPGKPAPELDAGANAFTLALSGALLDATKAGLTLRSNRLGFPASADPAHVRAATELLIDDRSRFMTGAVITLDGRGATGAASPRLEGKTILITGATSGIGRETAIEMGRLGAFVAVGGRKQPLAQETLDLVRAAGGDGMTVSLDVTSKDAWTAAIAAVIAARGAIHGLINNAGEQKNRTIAELAQADLQFLTDINYRGMRTGMDEALHPIAASGGGAIINIASVAGIRAGYGASAYGGSKAAMIGLSLAYARDFASTGVRVNALQPGFIWSDSVADSMGAEGAAAFRAMIEPRTPLGRVGAPDDVAGMIAFLLSDAAAAISGQAITVSGGLELTFP